MENAKILIYDGSFNGFLTAIFTAFEEKINVADIRRNTENPNLLFSDTETIFTEMDKAKRVWNGVQNKSHSAIKNIYFGFLSESKGVELLLYRYVKRLFARDNSVDPEDSGDIFLKVHQLVKSVDREKSRMESFIRFQSTKDNVYLAHISPDFDILPLISKYFRLRYADRQWIIYDTKRKYGLRYNLHATELISFNTDEVYDNFIDENDHSLKEAYADQELSHNSFKNPYIQPTTNNKLYPKHLSNKRHWSYESERTAV